MLLLLLVGAVDDDMAPVTIVFVMRSFGDLARLLKEHGRAIKPPTTDVFTLMAVQSSMQDAAWLLTIRSLASHRHFSVEMREAKFQPLVSITDVVDGKRTERKPIDIPTTDLKSQAFRRGRRVCVVRFTYAMPPFEDTPFTATPLQYCRGSMMPVMSSAAFVYFLWQLLGHRHFQDLGSRLEPEADSREVLLYVEYASAEEYTDLHGALTMLGSDTVEFSKHPTKRCVAVKLRLGNDCEFAVRQDHLGTILA